MLAKHINTPPTATERLMLTPNIEHVATDPDRSREMKARLGIWTETWKQAGGARNKLVKIILVIFVMVAILCRPFTT